MILKLLDDSKTLQQLVTDNSNGLGKLTECTSAIVEEERNGLFELEFTLPKTAKHFDDVKVNGLVKAKVNDTSNEQIFRIYKIGKEINGTVTVYCQHITYDLSNVPVYPFNTTGVSSALNGLISHTAYSTPFGVYTDIVNAQTPFNLIEPKSFRECLGGWTGSILYAFGGEYEWDNLTVKLLAHRGNDNGVVIRYGKNMTDLQQEQNIQSVYDGVLGFTNRDDNVTLGSIQTATQTNTPRVLIVDFTDRFKSDEEITVAKLNRLASAYIEDNEINVPKVNMKVSFVNLRDTDEYKNIAPLERVSLCDTVTVQFKELGVSSSAEVIKTTYDVLNERYISIELGQKKVSYADALKQNISSDIAEEGASIANSFITPRLQQMSELIMNGLGLFSTSVEGENGGVKFYLHNKPTLAESNIQYMMTENGMMVSTDYGQTWNAGFTPDGKAVLNVLDTVGINADWINAGAIDADVINVINLKADQIQISNSQETVIDVLESLQDQIDGAVNTWSGSAIPTLNNYPANEWTTTTLRQQHIGDLYYVIDGENQGKCYRFVEDDNGNFMWLLLSDSDLTDLINQVNDLNDTLITNYTTTVEMNRQFENNREGILSTVGETYTTKVEFENLNIGGRNLLSMTRSFAVGSVSGQTSINNTTNWYNFSDYGSTLTEDTYKECVIRSYNKTIDSSTPAAEYVVFLYYIPASKASGILEFNGTYTFSFWAKGTGKVRTSFYSSTSGYTRVKEWKASDGTTGNNTDGTKIWTLSSEWKRYWITYTLKDTGRLDAVRYLRMNHNYTDNATLDIQVCGCKMEKGNKPTDWTPAPEDEDYTTDLKLASYAKTETVNSQFTQTNDRISAVVSGVEEVERNYETLNSTVNNLSVGARNLYIEKTSVQGYIDTNGGITAPNNTRLERTSDYIAVSKNDEIIFQVWWDNYIDTTTNYGWVGYAFYDTNKTYVANSRVTTTINNASKHALYKKIEIPDGVAYIRVTFRTLGSVGNAKVKVEKGTLPTEYSVAPEDEETQTSENLLIDSESRFPINNGSTRITELTNVTVSEWRTNKALRVAGNSGTKEVFSIFGGGSNALNTSTPSTILNQQYVYGVYLKNNHSTNSIGIRPNIGNGTSYPYIVVTPGEEKFVYWTLYGNGSSYVQMNIAAFNSSGVVTTALDYDFTYWHPFMAYGRKPLWSPASIDVQNYTDTKLLAYSTTAQVDTKISQTKSDIELSVAGTYETKADFNTTMGNYYTKTQVDNAISVNTEGIELRAQKIYGSSNMLLPTPKAYNWNAYSCGQLWLTDNLRLGQEYTLQLWGVQFNNTGTETNKMMIYWGGGTVKLLDNLVPDANGYIITTFTPTQWQAQHPTSQNLWLNLYNTSNPETSGDTRNITIEKWQLTKGNNTGDKELPYAAPRDSVGTTEVISKINVTPENVKISADKVNIEGATIFSNGRLSETNLNNTYDSKGSASAAEQNAKYYADTIKQEQINLLNNTVNPVLQTSLSTTQWVVRSTGDGTGSIATVSDSPVAGYTKSFRISNNTIGNKDIGQIVPDFANQKEEGAWTFTTYVRGIGGNATALVRVYGSTTNYSFTHSVGTSWEQLTLPIFLKGTISNTMVLQFGITGAGSIEYIVPKLLRTDFAFLNTINDEQYIYITKNVTDAPTLPTTWITNANNVQNTWTLQRPSYNKSYPRLFMAKQTKTVGGVVNTVDLVRDNTTIIDGDQIITGTVSADKIYSGTLKLGGSSNKNGLIEIYNSSNQKQSYIDNTGAVFSSDPSDVEYTKSIELLNGEAVFKSKYGTLATETAGIIQSAYMPNTQDSLVVSSDNAVYINAPKVFINGMTMHMVRDIQRSFGNDKYIQFDLGDLSAYLDKTRKVRMATVNVHNTNVGALYATVVSDDVTNVKVTAIRTTTSDLGTLTFDIFLITY